MEENCTISILIFLTQMNQPRTKIGYYSNIDFTLFNNNFRLHYDYHKKLAEYLICNFLIKYA